MMSTLPIVFSALDGGAISLVGLIILFGLFVVPAAVIVLLYMASGERVGSHWLGVAGLISFAIVFAVLIDGGIPLVAIVFFGLLVVPALVALTYLLYMALGERSGSALLSIVGLIVIVLVALAMV